MTFSQNTAEMVKMSLPGGGVGWGVNNVWDYYRGVVERVWDGTAFSDRAKEARSAGHSEFILGS